MLKVKQFQTSFPKIFFHGYHFVMINSIVQKCVWKYDCMVVILQYSERTFICGKCLFHAALTCAHETEFPKMYL